MRPHYQERIASLVAAGGIIWAAKIASLAYYQMPVIRFPAGPLEICSAGVAVWLHAKWRRCITIR